MSRAPGPDAGSPDRSPSLRPVASGVLANLAVGTLFAWSLVAPDVTADVGAPPGSGSAVFAAALVVFTAVLLGVGRGMARFGPRWLLGAAAVLAGAGLGLTATAQRPELPWLGVGLLFGAANGVAYGVSVALAARVPERRRGAASGLVVGAYAAGPVLLGFAAPPALAVAGWRTALAVLAVTATGLLVAAAALAPADRAAGAGADRAREPVERGALVALWVLFAGGAAPGLVLFATAAPLAAARGLDAEAAGAAVSLLAAGNLAGRLAAGWWSDAVGRLPALVTALAVTTTALGALAVSSGAAAVLPAFAAVGLAYGAVSALVPAATADRVGARAFATVYGRVFTAWGCAGLLAPALAGEVAAAGSRRPGALLLLAAPVVPAVLAVVALARRPTGRGPSAAGNRPTPAGGRG
ncbi:MFS transporter [Geodermatophilus sabuli]|uniref:Nitrate/nitrite transporter NarK n=1 Tax=Geodermatophilus sabuli TaxID=1564158 RepID=A0A285EKI6_9ACTN|nr:MFS transporter [Geodermatophilus sabuli]MBB3083928.1 MFS family permease [Geodermatophilus sabuli]SNX98576.1 Nitrate/nitrite transporter NarK [Geodermatophilus sabuli]